VAAVPEVPGIASVAAAMEALKPGLVRQRQNNLRIRPKNRNRRRNDAFIRQGEWFFIPSPNLNVDPKLVLQNEPLRRGRGKPHVVEFLYRIGGETVYVSNGYPNGLTATQYGKLLSMEGVDLEIRASALRAIAKKALVRKTGARGLRSILEQSLIDTMFELPNTANVDKVVVDESTIDENKPPLLVYREAAKKA
jgi:hypothetical protein